MSTLKGMDTLLKEIKLILSPSEKGSAQKGNSSLLEKAAFLRGINLE